VLPSPIARPIQKLHRRFVRFERGRADQFSEHPADACARMMQGKARFRMVLVNG